MKRVPVKSLHPLTQKQQNWLWNQGSKQSGVSSVPWWVTYFDASAKEYENAYAVVKSVAFNRFVSALKTDMRSARTDRALWRKMTENEEFPPDLPRNDPYALPEYLSWWQAENAFRRGYMDASEDSFYEHLRDRIREAARAHRGVVTSEAWGEVAEEFAVDPIAHAFLLRFVDDPPESLHTKKLAEDLRARRDLAYQQFSPYYEPLRSVTGSGFFGLGRRR